VHGGDGAWRHSLAVAVGGLSHCLGRRSRPHNCAALPAWTVEDGAPSSIYTLAQTKDGYLWLGTFNGLFRFDGVRFQRYQPERGDPFPSQSIVALLATPDGGLWISFRTGGATFLENGRGHSFGESEGFRQQIIDGFALDREGAIWAGTYTGLFRFVNSHWHKIGTEWGYFSERAGPPFIDSQGKLWVNGYPDLYCLSPGAHVFNMRKVPYGWSIQQAPDGILWMYEAGKGTRAVYGPVGEFYDRSKASVSSALGLSLVDREGGFWMSSGDIDGIKRLSNPSSLPSLPIEKTSSLLQKFSHKDGLTSDFINRVLEDTEGNIWVATADGLDRFRRRPVVQGPFPTSKTFYDPVLVTDQEGILWEGSQESLWTVAGDGVSPREGPRLPLPIGFQITCAWRDFRGAIWIGGRGTLTRWSEGRIENVEFPDKEVAAGHWDVQSITGNQAGDLWVDVEQHGVYRRHDGVWEEYGKRLGLPKSPGFILWTDSKDRMWLGYVGNRIALLEGDRVNILSSPDGLHVGNVLAIGGRGDHIWAAGQFGLALYDGNKFHTIAGEADADFRGISGVVETANGDFWLNMTTGVARVPAAEIANRLRDPQHKLQYDLFDFRDGVRGTATQIRPLPSAVEAGDGRIWISGSNGVYWIDPTRIYKNPTPPPVTVEAIYAGDQRFSAFEASRLPKLSQNVRIEYTALSLSIPERVRFRYQLEGYDKDWQDVGTRRAAPLITRSCRRVISAFM
jgi:ligand-binding sensor domain-containing protein